MLRHFHKPIALLLATVIFYNASGHFLYFLVQQHAIRYAVSELLQQHKVPLVTVEISGDEAAALLADEAHEVYYQNELYDVVSQEKLGDAVKLYCYKDVKETRLLQHLGHQAKGDDAVGHKGKPSKLKTTRFSEVVFSEIDKLFFEQILYTVYSGLVVKTAQFIPGSSPRPPQLS